MEVMDDPLDELLEGIYNNVEQALAVNGYAFSHLVKQGSVMQCWLASLTHSVLK